MLHRINESETFCSYFGTQEQTNEGEIQSDTSISINDAVWFYRNKVGDNKSVFDIVRSGERRAITNNVNVGELCKHSFWWNGNGQQECGTSQESFIRTVGIEEVGTDKTKITRNSYETIFNYRIERASEEEGDRTISRPTKKESIFNSNEQIRQKINGREKEGNGKNKERGEIQENERIVQANHEVNRVSEINGIQLSIYNEVQVTVVECEWGVIIFKGNFQMTFGGSPCQGFSFAGKQLNFEDERSKLFFEFVRLKNELKPKYFLLENVRMKKEYQDVISKYMGVEPIQINSSTLSAQNRLRLYWTNIENVIQPEDKGVLLRDIILEDVEEKYYLTAEAVDYMSRLRNGKPRWEYHKNTIDGKAACLTANMYKGVPYGVLRIPEATKKGYVDINPNEGVDLTYPNYKTRRGRRMEDKSNCLTASTYDYCWYDGFICRKLTPIECERLQTFPDNYTEGVSNTQRYKALGNSWTVDVVSHIFNNLKE